MAVVANVVVVWGEVSRGCGRGCGCGGSVDFCVAVGAMCVRVYVYSSVILGVSVMHAWLYTLFLPVRQSDNTHIPMHAHTHRTKP